MANAFNMLRPNDLIWPYVVNVYMKGKRPSRSTCSTGTPTPPACRPPTTPSTCATATSRTSSPRARWSSAGVKLDLKKVRCRSSTSRPAKITSRPHNRCSRARKLRRPGGFRARRAPAISPASSIPPAKPKYRFWTGGPVEGELEEWIAAATETPGLLVALLVLVDREAGSQARRRARPGSAASSSRSATRRAPMCWKRRSVMAGLPAIHVFERLKASSRNAGMTVRSLPTHHTKKGWRKRRPFRFKLRNSQYLRTIGAGMATAGLSQRY